MGYAAPETEHEKIVAAAVDSAYDAGVNDAVEFFRKEFAKWAANKYGAGQRCLSFSEMLEESIKELLKD